VGEEGRYEQGCRDDEGGQAYEPLEQGFEEIIDVSQGHAQAEHADDPFLVLYGQGDVEQVPVKGRAVTNALACPALEGLGHLRPVPVVLQRGGVALGVCQHPARLVDDGDPEFQLLPVISCDPVQ